MHAPHLPEVRMPMRGRSDRPLAQGSVRETIIIILTGTVSTMRSLRPPVPPCRVRPGPTTAMWSPGRCLCFSSLICIHRLPEHGPLEHLGRKLLRLWRKAEGYLGAKAMGPRLEGQVRSWDQQQLGHLGSIREREGGRKEGRKEKGKEGKRKEKKKEPRMQP